jgi:hypothetical protein
MLKDRKRETPVSCRYTGPRPSHAPERRTLVRRFPSRACLSSNPLGPDDVREPYDVREPSINAKGK